MSELPAKPETTAAFGVHVAKTVTPARLGIGRSGGSLTTRELLDFDLAHARARDAVRQIWDVGQFEIDLAGSTDSAMRDVPVLRLASAAPDRATYLKRPDFGRRLSAESIEKLKNVPSQPDVAVIVSDGLSAQAAANQAILVLQRLIRAILARHWSMSPVLTIPFARVGISDDVGSILNCRASVILLGERPGLATPESLGAYVTFMPRKGRTDADRNCISNIHSDGLKPAEAADAIVHLLDAAFRHQLGGVALSVRIAEGFDPGGTHSLEKRIDR